MVPTNPVKETLKRVGRAAGLEFRKGAWYRRSSEVIAAIDAQRSNYGPSYYLNLGFWLVQLGASGYPAPPTAHIGLRLETLIPDDRLRVAEVLDLERAVPEPERSDAIEHYVSDVLLPLVERGSTKAGLRDLISDDVLQGAAIRGGVREALA